MATEDASFVVDEVAGAEPIIEDEDPEDDGTVCAICLDGSVYEDNEIIFCDTCDVAVHQLCYSVNKVPEGSWFCQVCASGEKIENVSCELCSNLGGAFKTSEKAGKWVHPLCATWIPEIYETLSKTNIPTLMLGNLDRKRFKLKCKLCTSKGACVQCCYGRCANAAHPWCVCKNPQGYAKRIVKDLDGDPVWEIFCKQHEKAVSEPYKQRTKPKSEKVQPPPGAEDNNINSNRSGSSSAQPLLQALQMSEEKLQAVQAAISESALKSLRTSLGLGALPEKLSMAHATRRVENSMLFSSVKTLTASKGDRDYFIGDDDDDDDNGMDKDDDDEDGDNYGDNDDDDEDYSEN